MEKGNETKTEAVPTEESGKEQQETNNDDWFDVLGSGRVLRKIVREGDGIETRPLPMSIVNIRCSAKSIKDKGKSLLKEEEKSLLVGDGESHPVFDMLLPLMETNQRILVKTTGDLTDFLGPPEKVLFDITMLSSQPVEQLMPLDENLLKLAERKRDIGNKLYKQGHYNRASMQYKKGIKMIQGEEEDVSDEDIPEEEDLRKECLLLWRNLALSEMKAERYLSARNVCNTLLHHEPTNTKGAYIKAKCLLAMNEPEEAMILIKDGLKENREQFMALYMSARSKLKSNKETSKNLYAKMAGSVKSTKTSTSSTTSDSASNNTGETTTWGILKRKLFSTWGLTFYGIPLLFAIFAIIYKRLS